MQAQPKILMLDDDQELLELYRCILAHLPSQPEVHTATTGARAMALLEAHPFDLLICDLKLPKIDGLQVLAIVRRKHPQLRVVVLTALSDEQYRSRAYALGVDLFWVKPGNEHEMKLFQDCIEALLGQEKHAGFRGVQSKSLVDIIQLECLSQNSAVLKITHGDEEGKIWLQQGDIFDAAACDLEGEPAFRRILSWKSGSFEILPPEPDHPRKIFAPPQALLLESAQALDEAGSTGGRLAEPARARDETAAAASPLERAARVQGVEFVVCARSAQPDDFAALAVEEPAPIAQWAWRTHERWQALGEELRAGELLHVLGRGAQNNLALARSNEQALCVGFHRRLSLAQVRQGLRVVLTEWAS